MYEIIACDLDEILIRTDRTISKEDIESIKKASQKGKVSVSIKRMNYINEG